MKKLPIGLILLVVTGALFFGVVYTSESLSERTQRIVNYQIYLCDELKENYTLNVYTETGMGIILLDDGFFWIHQAGVCVSLGLMSAAIGFYAWERKQEWGKRLFLVGLAVAVYGGSRTFVTHLDLPELREVFTRGNTFKEIEKRAETRAQTLENLYVLKKKKPINFRKEKHCVGSVFWRGLSSF